MFEQLTNAAVARPLAVASLLLGGGYFFKNFEVSGLDKISVSSKLQTDAGQLDPSLQTFSLTSTGSWSGRLESDNLQPSNTATSLTPLPAIQSQRALPALTPPRNLKIATWALGGFGPDRIDSPLTVERLAVILHQFDVVAIQQLRLTQQDFLPQLLTLASRNDRRFEFILGEPQNPSGEQLAFVFDANTVVTDRTQLYTVADPDHRMTYDPLVAWFRASAIDPRDAWTFSMVNVRIELPRARQEVAELPRIVEAVKRDGRREDDCLLVGLFQADDTYLQATLARQAMSIAVKQRPTDIFARHQTSNLMYNVETTSEAIGRAGVFDFLRQENLSLSEAEQISPYLPVYAEFTPQEGGFGSR